MKKFTVKRTGRTWGVFEGDKLIEGGYFRKDSAEEFAEALFDADERGRGWRSDPSEDFHSDG
jgi:hypothetical protein